MAKVISFLNEKGGCGKTTSVIETAFQLGNRNKKVLVVDLDPQANATIMLTGSANSKPALFDLLTDEFGDSVSVKEVIKPAKESWPGVLVLPADRRLAGLDTALANRVSRDTILSTVLESLLDYFDYILIDLPPAMNVGTVNALAASHEYLIPTDRSEYSRNAIPAVQRLAKQVKTKLSPTLKCLGVFMTGFEKGNSNAVKSLVDTLEKEHAETFLKGIKISHSVKVIESQREQKPVGASYPACPVAVAYDKLATLIEGENNELN